MSDLKPPRSREEMDFTIAGPSHVQAYRETNGERGYIWNNAPALLLTTKGRESGEPRTVPLIFACDGDDPVIIASLGGAPRHPSWYLNLQAEPHVQVQIKGDVFDAVARTAQSPERERLWAEAVKVWPQYDDYQALTDRQIPVVVLERAK
jgi:deazaflavin-dependent oxidoreductase (nitroreductase family)